MLSSQVIFAQGRVKGIVTAREDRAALSKVTIFIPELNIGTLSDETGTYVLNGLPKGSFQIQFSCIGYKTLVRSFECKGQDDELNVELSVSPIETEGIVVTAPRLTDAEKTAYQVESLSKEDIKNSGATTLTQSMTRLPGINQLTTGTGIGKPVIRGLHGNRVLTILNGLRFDNQQWQDEHGLGLSDVGIEKVEVIKGPASLMYGSEALGGVIHILDEKPAPVGTRQSDYSIKLNSNNFGVSTDYGVKASNEDFRWKLRIGGQSQADYLDGSNKRVPNTRLNGGDLKAGIGFNRPWIALDLNYGFSYYLFGVVEGREEGEEKEERIFARGAEEAHHAVQYHLLTAQNMFYFGRTKFSLDAGIHLNNRQEIEGKEEKKIGKLDMQLNTYSFNAKYYAPRYFLSDIIVGTEMTFQTNSNSGERVIIPDAATREISGFAYVKHDLSSLTVEEGIRVNGYHLGTDRRGTPDSMGYFRKIDKSYRTVNGSLGLAYDLMDRLLLKGNFSTGYRAPNLAELSSNGLHEGTLNYEIGDAALKSEKNFETDLSARIHTNTFSLEVSAFHNRITNFIYLSPSADTTAQGYKKYYFLQADAILKGGEIAMSWKPASVRWLELRSTYAALVAKKSGGAYIPLMPADKLTNELRFAFGSWSGIHNGYAALEMVSSFRQKRNASTESETPAYHLVNLSTGGSFKLFNRDVNAVLGCNNLLSRKYYDHLSRIKPGSFNDPATGYNNMGMDIYLNMTMMLTAR